MKEGLYIVTGGPNSGKTTIINELKKKGFNIIPEAATQIIEKELKKENSILPWGGKESLKKFQELVFKKQIQDLNNVKDGIYFSDRCFIDTISYFYHHKIEPPTEIFSKIKNYNYEKIFFLEMLEKNFHKQFEGRQENYEEILRLDQILKETYQKLKFEVIIVPNTLTIQERVNFILKNTSTTCS